jgi:Sperm tail C-terminal domain
LAAHEREFWSRLASVLPDQHVQAWQILERELLSYNKLLRDRGRCLDAIGRLQEENAGLKKLLNAYLADKVNDELIVPPTQTIQVANGPQPAH